MARTNVGKRDKGNRTRVPGGGHTHVDHIRDVVDVVLGHHRVGRCQVQQVVVPGLGALQLVLRVLGLSLWGGGQTQQRRFGRSEMAEQTCGSQDASSYQH